MTSSRPSSRIHRTRRLGALLAFGLALLSGPWAQAATLTPKEALGKAIFFDTNLSEPKGQSCASCHAPAAAFTDPSHGPTSRGATASLFGARNAPTAMYAAFISSLRRGAGGVWSGGQFLDGRAGNLEAQAKGPFLNPIEMGNPNILTVIAKVSVASYVATFKSLYGNAIFNNPTAAYNAVADAIATYERSFELAPFSSKFDAWQEGKATLTASEARGLALFNNPAKGNCAACHPSTATVSGVKPLFTDRSYDNLGVPRNAHNPFYRMASIYNPDGQQFIDVGLSSVTRVDATRGAFKVPTLRNVAKTAPYMHNGYFRTLRGVVDFYNTRDTRRRCSDMMWADEATAQFWSCWPIAEVADTMNMTELGRLGLTSAEVNDIVNFMGTLSDGFYTP